MAAALYIHWPFCVSKCPYCDFNSHVRTAVDVDAWREALIADLRFEAERAGGEALETIFLGGGTPSLMPPELVAALLAAAERAWGFSADIEITLEANPTSFEAGRFQGFAAAGVNRLSIGVQSFDNRALAFLGRGHSSDEALHVIACAQQLFARVSFDCIYALPGQTAHDWEAQLSRALSLGTGHLSLYQLTIEPGTRFASDLRPRKLVPMENDEAAELFALTRTMTEQAGLPAYEVSNHARPGEESRHNLAIWRYEDYCGIGPGAHGRRWGVATSRVRKPENWLDAVRTVGHGIAEERPLDPGEAASEALLMGLRLAEGVDLARLSDRFGIPQAELVDPRRFALTRDLGLVEEKAGRVRLTSAGMPVLDAILGELVPSGLVIG